MINMTETGDARDTAGGMRVERDRREGRDEIVLRFDWSTLVVAAAAFALGVVVGFVLD